MAQARQLSVYIVDDSRPRDQGAGGCAHRGPPLLPGDARIVISHPHWDHINALPFFAQGNQIEVCGPAHGDISMRDLISVQMDGVYFPITPASSPPA